MSDQEKFPTHAKIEIDKLRFDPQNPRLPPYVETDDDEKIIEWMLKDAGLLDLMGSIGEQGYFDGEPLLVVLDSESESTHYIVVEGNRRLAALKLLIDPSLAHIKQKSVQGVAGEAKEKPTSVPVTIYREREDILDYLGFRHVTGIKAWDSLAKARYLQELSKKYEHLDEGERFKQLAKNIGSKSNYVRRLLLGLQVYGAIEANDFFGIKDLQEDFQFSILTTALNYSNIADYLEIKEAENIELLELKDQHLQELTEWMFKPVGESGKTRLGESRNIKTLSAVVGNETALKRFQDGASLEEAMLFTQSPLNTFRLLIKKANFNLRAAEETLRFVREITPNDYERIKDLHLLLRGVAAIAKDRLDDDPLLD